jgi:hypothetical protein
MFLNQNPSLAMSHRCVQSQISRTRARPGLPLSDPGRPGDGEVRHVAEGRAPGRCYVAPLRSASLGCGAGARRGDPPRAVACPQYTDTPPLRRCSAPRLRRGAGSSGPVVAVLQVRRKGSSAWSCSGAARPRVPRRAQRQAVTWLPPQRHQAVDMPRR